MNSSVLGRLSAALAGRYTLERELGRGGMATVWLAQDLKHDRLVALKVLRPELAAALGPERFLREITLTAGLDHPHILPLLDSGEAGEFLYYTMPYVEGESLRQRLTRERQLPLDDAQRIAREVADALGYAHSRGVVHRDIKPENILLAGGHARVADFGIATALTAAGGDRLTETGIAVGTPAYMSPEQGAGSRDLDGRSDLYSLGCVLYEMLSGETPYLGNTPQAILAKKLTEPLPRISVLRDTVPEAIEAALTKVLARAPVDRYATAHEFGAALTAVPTAGRRQPAHPGTFRRAAAVLVAVLATVAAGWAARWAWTSRSAGLDTDPRAIPLDSTAIAVLPFRVVGGDTAGVVPTLAASMGDLVEQIVTGEYGVRIRHPGSVAQRWQEAGGTLETTLSHEAELAVARAVGAGRLLRGTVVEAGDSVMLSATLIDVATGTPRVSSVRMQGAIAHRFDLVDRLTNELLAREAGKSTAHNAQLLSRHKPEALQAMLAGLRAPFASDEQRGFFRAALAADSGLVYAAFYLFAEGERIADTAELRYAWEHQDQLSERDRAYLQVLAAGRHGTIRTAAQRIAGYEGLTQRWPEWTEMWSELGGQLTLYGAPAGIPAWRSRARQALDRIERPWFYPLRFLVDLTFREGDTSLARALLDSLEANLEGSAFDASEVLRGRIRLAIRANASRAAGQALDSVTSNPIFAVNHLHVACTEGRGFTDTIIEALPPTPRHARWALQRGRERWWRERWREVEPTIPVFGSLFLGMPEDSTAREAVQRLEALASGTIVPRPPTEVRAQAVAWSALWRLSHGDQRRVDAARRYLTTQVDRPWRFAGWVGLIDVLRAQAEGGDVRAAVLRLDSIVRGLPLPRVGDPAPAEVQNLLLARMLAQIGEPQLALAAIRRRPTFSTFLCSTYWSTPEYLREEGRLAAMVGDTPGAIKAYRHYLALREDPDPPWRATWDSVRAELAALVER